ncbi:MAG: ABC-type nitrate/sulfonate/bicarbonate transport system, permease component [Rhizobium sp.]|nr:ABC-type nitrate/sulfonate/bicarbonate transport system, permease component [Rhizobium sp.]
MMSFKFNWQSVLAALAFIVAMFSLPLTTAASAETTTAILVVTAAAIALAMMDVGAAAGTWGLLVLVHIAVFQLLTTIHGAEGTAGWSFFLVLVACWLLAWRLVTMLSGDGSSRSGNSVIGRVIVPALFGIWILIIWEAITRGAGVPFVLLPPPSAIGARILTAVPTLAADFRQTVLKAVLFGFFVGSGAGFLVAILADRFRFLSNGLLPVGNLVSALPIIGIAPVMVIWFGFDWQSKAAVVIVMTFFPMLVNTIEGLKASGRMERDLMQTYGSSHWQTLFKLRLPAAMPFIFNALKINSTLALIGALVSEFFGTPIVGMGFRISTEVGRMNLDMVWAEIALAAVVGSLFYGAIALLERAVTFWHPSYR